MAETLGRAVTKLENDLGNQPERRAQLEATVAMTYEALGLASEAIPLQERAREYYVMALGLENTNTLNAMNNMANSYDDAGRRVEALKLREQGLALNRKVSGPENPVTIDVMNDLAESYLAAGRGTEALSLLAEAAAAKPGNSLSDIKLAAYQAWLGKDADYTATCRRFLQWTKHTTEPADAERASKSTSIRRQTDPQMREAALVLARRAVELASSENIQMHWFQMALGMAEYRSGHYPEAERALLAATRAAASADNNSRAKIEGISGFYRAMSVFQQGKPSKAISLFTATEAAMKPFPKDEQKPAGANHDDLILWLACKEAKALLSAPAPKP